jgi:hypothetical protein
MSNSYNVLVQTGYCEDANNGWLWMNLESEKQLTNKQIWGELAEALRECARLLVKGSWYTKHEKCPKLPIDAKFCASCGVPAAEIDTLAFETEAGLNAEAADILRGFQEIPCHRVRQEFVEILELRGWSLWGRPINGRMVFLSAPDRGLEDYEGFPEIESKRVTFK